MVRISYQHANPNAGNESFLVRFETGNDETQCVLIDAGHGVNLDALLDPSDRLAAICLTHAHADHYSTISDAHRDDAPILTSPATAAVLDDVLDIADTEYDVTRSAAVDAAVTPIENWTYVAPDIDIHPVPAGHVPGATGFLVRVTAEARSHHLLATGDFTRRRAGGFPGFDPKGFVDVDTLFLTAATNDRFEASLTRALGTALEHAHGGAPTLVTTSGIVGPQIAYLLAVLADEHDLRIPIRTVGQVAKLYEALEYDCSRVETIPQFRDPSGCIDPGIISIAGPDVPEERSSGRLFDVIQEDPNACVVQLVGSGKDPVSGHRCTVHSYELINHPTRETLVEVHDALNPTQTVITHRHGGVQEEFNDLSSAVWGVGNTDEYTLFDGHHWKRPPGVAGQTVSSIQGRSVRQFTDTDLISSLSGPSLNRYDGPDLEAEGIETAQIAARLHQGPAAAASPDAPVSSDDRPDADVPDTEPISTTMNRNSNELGEQDTAPTSSNVPTGLIRTTGLDCDELDPASQAVLDNQSLTPEEFAAILAARKHITAADLESSRRAERSESGGESEPEAQGNTTDVSQEAELEAAATEAASGDPGNREGYPTEGVSDSDKEDVEDHSTTELESETKDTGPDASSDAADDEPTNGEPHEDDSPGLDVDESSCPEADNPEIEPGEKVRMGDLNPLAIALAERTAARESKDSGANDLLEKTIVDAVGKYVVALLAGDASGTIDERFIVDIDGSRAVERALVSIIENDDQLESTSELVAHGVASALGSELSESREISGLDMYRPHLDAIRDNEAYYFSDTVEIIEAAIAWDAIRE